MEGFQSPGGPRLLGVRSRPLRLQVLLYHLPPSVGGLGESSCHFGGLSHLPG